MKRSLLILIITILCFSGAYAQSEPPPQSGYKTHLPMMQLNRMPEWIGPEGGLVSAVVIDPHNTDILYAASWGGGVYKSLDGGSSWTWKSNGLANLTVVSLAIDPHNPLVLYAGTYHGKLFKTIDGGNTWFLSSKGVQEEAIVYSIVVDPNQPQIVYMSTRGISNEVTPPWRGVIYRSDDAGETWNVILDDLAGKDVQDWAYALALHPTIPNLLFAATHEQGIIYTTNRGYSWKEANEGITNFSTRAVVFGPTQETHNQVYTAVWEKRGVFKSINLGESWEQMDNGSSGAQLYWMDINPFDPNTLYLASYNMGVLKTINGGKRWYSAGLEQFPIATVRVHPTKNGTLFAGTVGEALFQSKDGGASWAPSRNGLNASSVTSLVISPLDPEVYFAGTQGRGVLRSPDQGQTWLGFNQGLPSRYINALVQQPGRNILFAITNDAGLYRCDLQKTEACWQWVGGLAGTAQNRPATPLRFSSENTFLEAYGGTELSASQVWPPGPGLLALAFAPSDPDIGYLGGAGSGVFRTEDGGLTWIFTGLPGRTVWSLAVDPQNPNRLYAATDQVGSVRVSSDGGRSWTDASIPGVTGYTLAFSPATPGTLFAGTSNGVYRLVNNTWQPSGLAGSTIISLAFHPTRPGLLAAGAVGGAFISTNGGDAWEPGPSVLQNHTVQSLLATSQAPDELFFLTTAHGILRAEIAP